MNKTAAAILMCLLLNGCNLAPVRDEPQRAQGVAGACAKLDDPAEVQLGLVRQMLEQGRAYAGLAHLDALEPAVRSSAQARYLNAELLRHTGNAQDAERHYRELLGGCLAGHGHHGLGLLSAERDLGQAVIELREAARMLPTESRVRNDLGYALLLMRDSAGARREFMTAIELGDYKQRAAHNLLLLMLYEGDERGAERLRQQLDLSDAGVERLRRQAVQIRVEGNGQSNGEG